MDPSTPGPSARAHLPGAAVLLLAALPLVAGACGYTLGSLVREDARTLCVPIFHNDTREREIEYPLTRAVVRELRARGYTITSQGPARAELRGRILKVEQTVTAEDPRDRDEAGAVKITVEITLRSAAGTELLRRRVSETGEFARVRGESRFSAREQALGEIALAVVRSLASDRF
jgi:hypothetical protein